MKRPKQYKAVDIVPFLHPSFLTPTSCLILGSGEFVSPSWKSRGFVRLLSQPCEFSPISISPVIAVNQSFLFLPLHLRIGWCLRWVYYLRKQSNTSQHENDTILETNILFRGHQSNDSSELYPPRNPDKKTRFQISVVWHLIVSSPRLQSTTKYPNLAGNTARKLLPERGLRVIDSHIASSASMILQVISASTSPRKLATGEEKCAVG
jgi:hypothetical protein